MLVRLGSAFFRPRALYGVQWRAHLGREWLRRLGRAMARPTIAAARTRRAPKAGGSDHRWLEARFAEPDCTEHWCEYDDLHCLSRTVQFHNTRPLNGQKTATLAKHGQRLVDNAAHVWSVDRINHDWIFGACASNRRQVIKMNHITLNWKPHDNTLMAVDTSPWGLDSDSDSDSSGSILYLHLPGLHRPSMGADYRFSSAPGSKPLGTRRNLPSAFSSYCGSNRLDTG